MREGSSNPNWKGGISSFRKVDDLLEIRPYLKNSKPSNQKELAAEFGVGVHVIQGIVRGQTWRSVL